MASPLLRSCAHTPALPSHPPGQRVSPSMAKTSARRCGGSASAAAAAAAEPLTRVTRWAASARGVGWSKMRVGCSRRPDSSPTRAASSVAARLSMPASMKGVVARTCSASAPASLRTTESSSCSTYASWAGAASRRTLLANGPDTRSSAARPPTSSAVSTSSAMSRGVTPRCVSPRKPPPRKTASRAAAVEVSCGRRHAANSSRLITKAACGCRGGPPRSSSTAPMPEPLTKGSCRESATSPAAARLRAAASSDPLAPA
mmetsp:Transcript_40569/g.130819  ORF Transcript_40569/g.130819 Transcript_40569/m.130819 type:complete len:259 (+) Transcript_40569:1394-2170(+)